MLNWIQSLSWVAEVVNRIKKLFEKTECSAPAKEPDPVAAAPAQPVAAPKKPRRRKPATKPKQQ